MRDTPSPPAKQTSLTACLTWARRCFSSSGPFGSVAASAWRLHALGWQGLPANTVPDDTTLASGPRPHSLTTSRGALSMAPSSPPANHEVPSQCASSLPQQSKRRQHNLPFRAVRAGAHAGLNLRFRPLRSWAITAIRQLGATDTCACTAVLATHNAQIRVPTRCRR